MGSIERYGAVLKEVGTGRIVGHLQETGVLHSVVSVAGTAANPVTGLIQAGSGVAANFQLYRLDNKVDALRSMLGGMQAMQFGNLALAGVGIGISALGFAVVKSRLDMLSQKIDGLAEEIRAGFQEQRESRLRDYEAKLSGELDNAEEGWHARDGGRSSWTHVVTAMSGIESFYAREIEAALNEGAAPQTLAYLIDRYRVSIASKLQCYVLLDEWEQGRAYAEKVHHRSAALFDRVTPISLSAGFARTPLKDKSPWESLGVARAICAGLRELQDMQATSPFLLRRLNKLGVCGRDYVLRLRSETQEPLLVLRAESQL